MALKYAGARYAKFFPDGTLELVEFAPELPDGFETAPQIETAPAVDDLPHGEVIAGEVIKHPGYAALFTNTPPRFRPSEG